VSPTPPPSLSALAHQLTEITQPDAVALLQRGEQSVIALDREAFTLWSQIVLGITHMEDVNAGMIEVARSIPEVMPMQMGETQRACAALRADLQQYFNSQMQALMGASVTASRETNLKHIVIGLKGMHSNALAVQQYLRQQRSRE